MDKTLADFKANLTSDFATVQSTAHCHKPDCQWLSVLNLTQTSHPIPLTPEPELSGTGVILGFSIIAYFSLFLLLLHYFTVLDVHRTKQVNALDNSILSFVRCRIVTWRPSRRFEHAMEKSVLILSDTQLVTGLGILVAGYSQLRCGISAYHWQIMAFVAWTISFSFLSSMAFLEHYLQNNTTMRLIRLGFTTVLTSLLIGALLPTGSRNFLNLYNEDGQGYYPGLNAICYYMQMTMGTFISESDPKAWSMSFSVCVVVLAYIRCTLRLFDPGASASYRYLRAWPGIRFKGLLRLLEQKIVYPGFRGKISFMPYLLLYAIFTSCRALADIIGSKFCEIIWLTFAMAWGTIKIWTTKYATTVVVTKHHVGWIRRAMEDDFWSFGQTLPLVLILLPVLSMIQTYLDNDALGQTLTARQWTIGDKMAAFNDPPRQSSERQILERIDSVNEEFEVSTHLETRNPPRLTENQHVHLPRYPYAEFTFCPWYKDHILLLLCQILMVTSSTLWILTAVSSVMGIKAVLRHRLFLVWVFAMIPLASLAHLAAWYLAAFVIHSRQSWEDWLKGRGMYRRSDDTIACWWRRVTVGQLVFCVLRMGLVGLCLAFTFLMSLEIAGPRSLGDYL